AHGSCGLEWGVVVGRVGGVKVAGREGIRVYRGWQESLNSEQYFECMGDEGSRFESLDNL
nr:hypothetical protein [Tanacetum cinerariifolium]